MPYLESVDAILDACCCSLACSPAPLLLGSAPLTCF